jgi:hypothetical protein
MRLELANLDRLVILEKVDANDVVVATGRQKRPTGTERYAQHLSTTSRLLDELLRLRANFGQLQLNSKFKRNFRIFFLLDYKCIDIPLPETDGTIVTR